jgi:hypothetical protein
MVSIQQSGGTIDFKRDSSDGQIKYSSNGGTWNVALFPVTIVNTPNASSSNILTVRITMDITFNDDTNYFICGSQYITFDGMNNTCTFNNITGYIGLIQNGTNSVVGFSNITVKNINAASTGSDLLIEAGWVCCSYFGKSTTIPATNILITNCSSSGEITSSSGGILGSRPGSVTITNCSSSGNISFSSGGICGIYAGSNGLVTIINCSSSGNIGSSSGGICGAYTGNGNGGSIDIINCYSRGAIYMRDAGGICGPSAGINGGSAHITNCYSYGQITGTNAGGIYGNSNSSTATRDHCYPANGFWNPSASNFELTGTPVSSTSGISWAYDGINNTNPYIFSDYLYITDISLGTVENTIDIQGLNLGTVTSVFINGGITSMPFTILSTTLINATGNYSSITSVTVENDTESVTYNVPICFVAGTPVQTDQGIIHIDKINPKIHTIHNQQIIAITRTVTKEDTLVCIEPDALAPNVPCEKTTVSRCHAILFRGKMVRAKKLVSLISDKAKVYHVKYNGEILYNVLMECNERISVNNMIAETLDPNHMIAKLYLGNNKCKIGQKMIA